MQVATFFSSSTTLSAATGSAGASAATAAGVDASALAAGTPATAGGGAALDNSAGFESLLDSQTSAHDDANSSSGSLASDSDSETDSETKSAETIELPSPDQNQPVYSTTILAAAMAAAAIAPEPMPVACEPVEEGTVTTETPQVISCGVGEFENVLDDAAAPTPPTMSTTMTAAPPRRAPIALPAKGEGDARGTETNSVDHDAADLSAGTPVGQQVSAETRRTEEISAAPSTPVRAAAMVATPSATAVSASPVFTASPLGGYKGTPHPLQIALAAPGTFAPDVRTVPLAPTAVSTASLAGQVSAAPVETASASAVTQTTATAAPLTPTAVEGTPVPATPTSTTGVAIPAVPTEVRTVGPVPNRAVTPLEGEEQVFRTTPDAETPLRTTTDHVSSLPVRLAPLAPTSKDTKSAGTPSSATLAAEATVAAPTEPAPLPVRLAPLASELLGDRKPTNATLTTPTTTDLSATETTVPDRVLLGEVRMPEHLQPQPEETDAPADAVTAGQPVRLPPRAIPVKPMNPQALEAAAQNTDAAFAEAGGETKNVPPPFAGDVKLEQPADGETPEVRLQAFEVSHDEAEHIATSMTRGSRRLSAWNTMRPTRDDSAEASKISAEVQGTPSADAANQPTDPAATPTLPWQTTVSTIRSLTPAMATAWAEAAAAQQRPVARRDREGDTAAAPASIFDSIPSSSYEVETVTLDLSATAVVAEAMANTGAGSTQSGQSDLADSSKFPSASDRAISVASSASALSTPREIPSAGRGKNVPVGPKAEAAVDRRNLQVADEQALVSAPARLGTPVAEKAATMPTTALPPAPTELLRDLLPNVSAAAMSGHSTRANGSSNDTAAAESTQLRSYAAATVKEVAAAAERLVPPRTTVELRLQAFEQENVRVQLVWREGTIHARFITETPELQQALTREWENSSGRFAERGLKFGEATFEQRDHHQASGNAYSQEQHGRSRRQYADREFPEFALPSFLSAVTGRAASVPVDLPSMSGALHPLTNSQRGLRAWA